MFSMRPVKLLLQLGLLITLLLFCLGARYVDSSIGITNTSEKRQLVILPGRESFVMNFLEPVLKIGFSGMKVSDISIKQGEIRLLLAPPDDPSVIIPKTCPMPEWGRAPGMLVILPTNAPAPRCSPDMPCGSVDEADLRLSWASCGPADAARASASDWIKTLAQRNRNGIWEEPPAHVVPYSPKDGGLLAPLLLTTGLEKTALVRLLLALSLGTSLFAALFLRWKMGPSPSYRHFDSPRDRQVIRRRLVFLGLMVVLGMLLRIHAAVELPRDPDEGLVVQRVLSGSHDSWVHPPLHGILNNFWIQEMHLPSDAPLWKFRLPSLIFSFLTLCLLALAVIFSRLRAYAELPFVLVALLPSVVIDNSLTRPYALSIFGATLCLLALSSRDFFKSEKEDWFSWFVALVALGLTVWSDLMTALFVGCFVLARWLHRNAFPEKAKVWGRIVTAMSVIVWVLPFAFGLPGSVAASQELKWPYRSADDPSSTINAIGDLLRQCTGTTAFEGSLRDSTVVGIFALGVGYLVVLARKRRSSTAVGLSLMCGVILLVLQYMGLRTRNVMFVPVALALVGAIVAPRLRAFERR